MSVKSCCATAGKIERIADSCVEYGICLYISSYAQTTVALYIGGLLDVVVRKKCEQIEQ